MQKEPSFHHFHVQHFCPLAQALDQLGDRWAFLVVRDLRRGPLRFTDLLHYMVGITPKRLTVQLRTLEAEGIIERDREEGRREVWYCLTEKGRALMPVIEALATWSLEYVIRKPEPGETVYPDHMMPLLGKLLNKYGTLLPHPVKWAFRFGERQVYTISFNGEQWDVAQTEAPDADVHIETTPETWATWVVSPTEERQRLLDAMRVSGEPSRVSELFAINWIGKQP